MTRTFPRSVDVAIVGSGPCGAAYARILSEQCPSATVATFEVGPLLADPPGSHVKNIVDLGDRALAQRRSEGPAPQGDDTPTDTMEGYVDESPRLVRPGTFLLATGYQQPGEDGLPGVAMSSNVGGMGAHWTGACPRPGGAERVSFLPELDELLAEGERLLRSTPTRSTTPRSPTRCASACPQRSMTGGTTNAGSRRCRSRSYGRTTAG